MYKLKPCFSRALATIFLSALAVGVDAATPKLINGAGATFPFPVYSRWFKEYSKVHPDVQINYQSIGSGGGIKQLLEGTVDFGASDDPMKKEETAKAKHPVIHVPTVLGAVVVSYNLNLAKPLKLSGPVIADIYLGKIKKWNDPAIAKLNDGLALPDQPILVAHRSDGSGTSAVFTDFLSKVSPEWKEKVGSAKALSWPTGLGGKGNEGVAGLIKQNPGAIGYIELVYAVSNKLAYADVQNAAGEFVTPSTESVSAAAAASVKEMLKNDFKASITNAQGKKAYPISSFTWLLVYENMPKGTGLPIVEFIHWALSEQGQTIAKDLNYAPLPKELSQAVLRKVKTISLN